MSTVQGSHEPQASQGASVVASMLCPLCKQRPADTVIHYDEVLSSTTTISMEHNNVARSLIGTQLQHYSTQLQVDDGEIVVCAPCAARYENSMTERQRGRNLLNWGIGLLFGGGLLFLIIFAIARGTLIDLVATIPLLAGIVVLGVATGLLIAGGLHNRPILTYMREQAKQQ